MSSFKEFVQIAYQIKPNKKILRGSATERKIHEQLRIELSRDYHVMHNVLLPNGGKHGFSQIDHLVISKFGIFCIEEKAHSGKVFGDSQRGKLFVRYGGKVFPMINPVTQNKGHIKAIKYVLGDMIKAPIESIVVLPNASSLNITGSERDICPDVFLADHIRYSNYIIYSDSEVARIKTTLIHANFANNPKAVNYHHQSIRSQYQLAA